MDTSQTSTDDGKKSGIGGGSKIGSGAKGLKQPGGGLKGPSKIGGGAAEEKK